MTNKDHEKIEPTREQMDPGLADPRDFVVMHNDEPASVPAHGQCGRSKREYNRLLKTGAELANASNFSDEPAERPNVNDAGEPKTQGIGRE